jgi:hypothetical protein
MVEAVVWMDRTEAVARGRELGLISEDRSRG